MKKRRPGVTFAAQDSADREAMQRARSRGGKKTTALRAIEKELKRRAKVRAKYATGDANS